MRFLLGIPATWLMIINLLVIIIFSVILLVAYALERLGRTCEKFNDWASDRIGFVHNILFSLLLTPVYIITSFFGYLGKICYVFNRKMNDKSDYKSGKGWTSRKKTIFKFLLNMLCASIFFAIVGIVIEISG